jgi:hypothetical protein
MLCKKHMLMKKFHYFVLLLITIGLISCSKETSGLIESYSTDQEMKIAVQASRQTKLDAWILEIQLTHGGETSTVYQEFYADDVSKNNIKFHWKSERSCLIQLTQRDGVVISVPIKVHEN